MINMRQEGFTSQGLKVYKYMRVELKVLYKKVLQETLLEMYKSIGNMVIMTKESNNSFQTLQMIVF